MPAKYNISNDNQSLLLKVIHHQFFGIPKSYRFVSLFLFPQENPAHLITQDLTQKVRNAQRTLAMRRYAKMFDDMDK
jgi:hypothetical protein